MKKIIAGCLLIGLFSIGALAAEAKPKIGMKRAQEIASSKARGLQLKAKELEHEKGRWIYSFEFKNRDGSIREVNVDAYTGKIIGVEHEDPKKEASEEKNEKKGKN